MPAATLTAPQASEPPSALAELRAMLADVQERLNTLTQGAAECPHILTTEEATRYVKAGSASAFYRWAEKWDVEPSAYGRWSRAKIDMALAREAGLTRTPATLRRRQAEALSHRDQTQNAPAPSASATAGAGRGRKAQEARSITPFPGTTPENRDPAGANQRGQ